MFLGHFALGFAAKRWAKQTSLGTLFLAAQFLDLLWPILLLFGVEQVAIRPNIPGGFDFIAYPYSHSLLFVLVWALLAGFGWYALRRRPREAMIIGLLVISHWFLDLLVHIPDLPLWPGGPRVGLGLWRYPWFEFGIEIGLFAVGASWYLLATKAMDGVGRYGAWALFVLLVLSHLSTLLAGSPPSVAAVAWGAQLQWLFVLLAYWVDAHRAPGKTFIRA